MSAPSKTGTYMGRPEAWGVVKKDSGTVQFDLQIKLNQYRNGSGFEDIEGMERITAYLNLIKKDGGLNQINVDNIKAALGWDGTSFASLQDTDWSMTDIQVVVIDEADQHGAMQRRVRYINPKDYTGGGVEKADEGTVKSLDAMYGSLLRATSTPAKATKGKAKADTAAPTIGKEIAWATYSAKVDAYNREDPKNAYTEKDKVKVFKDIFYGEFGDVKSETLNPKQWAEFKTLLEKDFIPSIRGISPI